MRHDQQSLAIRHRRVFLALVVCLCAAAGVRRASALELTGVLLLPVSLEGNPIGPVWHTASGDQGRPLALTGVTPSGVRQAPLLNGVNGEIDVSLLNVVDLIGFWQFLGNEFPPAMVMNLYFNGDNLTPGISVVMGSNAGLSQYMMNRSPQALSLYLGDVENRPALFFDDGTARVTLGPAFYFASVGLTNQWRLSQLENIDRVGVDGFARDGHPDGVLVFELLVGPSTQPSPLPTLQAQSGFQAAPAAVPAARVGEDLWVAPTPDQWAPEASTPLRTPAAELSDSEGTPTAARTAERGRAPTTPMAGSVTPGAGGASTPTPAQTHSRTTTPGTPPPAAGTAAETPAAGAATPHRS